MPRDTLQTSRDKKRAHENFNGENVKISEMEGKVVTRNFFLLSDDFFIISELINLNTALI